MKTVRDLCREYETWFRKAGLIEQHECPADVIGKTIVVHIQAMNKDGSFNMEGLCECAGGTVVGFSTIWMAEGRIRSLSLTTTMVRLGSEKPIQLRAEFGESFDAGVLWGLCELSEHEYWTEQNGIPRCPMLGISSLAVR